MGTLDVTNFDDMAEEFVQAVAESDQLNQEEQDADLDEDLSTPPNPRRNPAHIPDVHDHRKQRYH